MAKDLNNSQMVQNLLAATNALGIRAPKDTTTVGTNGYTIGQQFHATGLKLIQNDGTEPGSVKCAYVAITTKEGVDLSLKSVMSLSSLNGFETEGKFENHHLVMDKKTKKEIEIFDTVEADFGDEDFDRVFQPSTRNLLQFIAEAEGDDQNAPFFEGKVITYLGRVVRPYTAKKDSESGSFEKYTRGMQRAMAVRLWAVEEE